MESYEPKKLALLRILQILQEQTDCDHPLTQAQIAEILEHKYNITVERKAIGRNLALLQEAGYEIDSCRAGFYLHRRMFEDSELRLLIDGVLSSRHITAKHSADLIDRLCRLSNVYFRSGVKHIHSVNDWSKTDNQEFFLSIEQIVDAVERGRKVRYEYFKYGVDKRLHKTSLQIVSPYQMILHNQRYYLMAYNSLWGHMVFHRIDRIKNMLVLDEPALPVTEVKGYEKGIEYKNFSSAMPYMYADRPEMVEFLADAGIVDQIVDWFGTGVRITRTDDENKVKVTLRVSPSAMQHWATQYVDHVEVTYPAHLRTSIRESLEKGAEKYR